MKATRRLSCFARPAGQPAPARPPARWRARRSSRHGGWPSAPPPWCGPAAQGRMTQAGITTVSIVAYLVMQVALFLHPSPDRVTHQRRALSHATPLNGRE